MIWPLDRDPGNSEYHNSLGNARRAAGDLEGAVKSYRRALEIAPDHLPTLYNLGLVLSELKRPEESEPLFRRVHELDPGDADALFHLGSLLADGARSAEAVQAYRSALELTPDNPYLWMALGMAYQGVPGQMAESVRCLRKCIALKPDLADAHYDLGLACRRLGRDAEAVESYGKALELEPGYPGAHNDLGNILQDEGRFDEAVEHYRAAIRAAPGYALAHSNLGNALARQGRLKEAVECYRKAIELEPDFPGAHLNLGSTYSLQGARDLAIGCYETALRLAPDNAAARQGLLFEMQYVCDWSRFEELCELQRRSVLCQPEQLVSPFSLLSIPSTPQEQLQCARNYSARLLRAVSRDREQLNFQFERRPKSRIRIGYLSAEFRESPVAHLAVELFERHDRARFEVIAYSYGPDDGSAIRSRLKQAFDQFVDVSPLSYADAAARIHRDQVDILVDLQGHTQHARTEIVALRPAPIQVSYLYTGTMGADFIDYLIADRFVAPPDRAGDFSEKLVWLPGCFQVNTSTRAVEATPARGELGLPEGAFVFCSFNQAYKILPIVFQAWMRLLAALPEGVLWLFESNPQATLNLRREAQKRGVDADRLVFAPRMPLARHLGRLRAADLFLDTLPYNAHSTASGALWIGLPVVTCVGDTIAARLGGSILTALGVPELVTRSMDEYETLALRLARNRGELVALREKLSRNRLSSPLFDTPGYVRHLEAAYLQMWSNYLAGNAPAAIEILGP